MQVFFQNILRETVLPDDFAEKHGARFRPSFKGREIDINQTEARLETSPFILIHERPVEITAQINTPKQCIVNRGEIKRQINNPEPVVIATASVFRNINRFNAEETVALFSLRSHAKVSGPFLLCLEMLGWATESQTLEERVIQQPFRH